MSFAVGGNLGDGLVTDFGTTEGDVVALTGFGPTFDPPAALTGGATGAVLDLGG